MLEFKDMIGKVFRAVKKDQSIADSTDAIVFEVSDEERYGMFYQQDCCASCDVEDICGDLEWLVDTPIIRAEENGNAEPEMGQKPDSDSETWTFYRIGTVKGTVVIRWYGSSNGYYSETPCFERLP